MQCCGRFPMTGERSPLTRPGGDLVAACPRLTAGGLCSAYFSRPQGCRDFTCHAYNTDAKKIPDFI